MFVAQKQKNRNNNEILRKTWKTRTGQKTRNKYKNKDRWTIYKRLHMIEVRENCGLDTHNFGIVDFKGVKLIVDKRSLAFQVEFV